MILAISWQLHLSIIILNYKVKSLFSYDLLEKVCLNIVAISHNCIINVKNIAMYLRKLCWNLPSLLLWLKSKPNTHKTGYFLSCYFWFDFYENSGSISAVIIVSVTVHVFFFIYLQNFFLYYWNEFWGFQRLQRKFRLLK